jgi:hypothetical protein
MDNRLEQARAITRRTFFRQAGLSLGAIAFGSLLERDGLASPATGAAGAKAAPGPFSPRKPHFAPKAKSIIYLHMSGAPPTLDLFDYKPKLVELNMQPCPESLLKGQRFAFIKGVPKMLGTPFKFHQHGKSGMWVTETLPQIAEIVDEIALIRSMTTDQFNHAPAELFLYTGSPRAGGASMGSWLTYGLGSENQDLPGFVVLISGGTDPTGGKALWSSGFLPSVYQGVQCRSAGEPILYLNDPAGMSRQTRRRSLDTLDRLNEQEVRRPGDRDADRPVRAGIPDADRRPGDHGHLPGAEGDPGTVRRRARPGDVRQQLSPRPPPRREGCPLRPALRLGLGHPRHRQRRRPAERLPQEV